MHYYSQKAPYFSHSTPLFLAKVAPFLPETSRKNNHTAILYCSHGTWTEPRAIRRNGIAQHGIAYGNENKMIAYGSTKMDPCIYRPWTRDIMINVAGAPFHTGYIDPQTSISCIEQKSLQSNGVGASSSSLSQTSSIRRKKAALSRSGRSLY